MIKLVFGGQNFISFLPSEFANRLHLTRAFFQASAALNTKLLIDVVGLFPFAADGPGWTTFQTEQTADTLLGVDVINY